MTNTVDHTARSSALAFYLEPLPGSRRMARHITHLTLWHPHNQASASSAGSAWSAVLPQPASEDWSAWSAVLPPPPDSADALLPPPASEEDAVPRRARLPLGRMARDTLGGEEPRGPVCTMG